MKILTGDAVKKMRTLESESVDCIITSPPYYALRDYGRPGQIGLEQSVDEYVATLVGVFAEARRLLKKQGTLWLNLGDSYSHSGAGARNSDRWPKQSRNDHMPEHAKKHTGLKPKNLIGIPWRVAFALQQDGWYLRQDIIWHKPNPMPESVKDRLTKAHEYIFLLAKSETYFYDADAIKEPAIYGSIGRIARAKEGHKTNPTSERNGIRPRQDSRANKGRITYQGKRTAQGDTREQFNATGQQGFVSIPEYRNKRDVWTVATKPYKGAHFATFPENLIRPMVRAGSPLGGTVLDPFAGSGTTLAVAAQEGRDGIGIELNPQYVALARARLRAQNGDSPSPFVKKEVE